jgi:ribosome assembly protein YihI (activator of Der GTPase)
VKRKTRKEKREKKSGKKSGKRKAGINNSDSASIELLPTVKQARQ